MHVPEWCLHWFVWKITCTVKLVLSFSSFVRLFRINLLSCLNLNPMVISYFRYSRNSSFFCCLFSKLMAAISVLPPKPVICHWWWLVLLSVFSKIHIQDWTCPLALLFSTLSISPLATIPLLYFTVHISWWHQVCQSILQPLLCHKYLIFFFQPGFLEGSCRNCAPKPIEILG